MARKKQNFEDALSRLEEIVKLIENEDTKLEDAIKLYKEGNELSVFCSETLLKIEQEVTSLKKTSDGSFRQDRFELEEDFD